MRKSLLMAVVAAAVVTAPARADVLNNMFSDQIFTDTAGAFTDLIGTFMPGVTNLRIGLGPVYGPKFEGGNNHDIDVAPLISLRYRDIVEVDNNNIRINVISSGLLNTDNFKAGPLIKLDFGRDESDAPVELLGLGNVGTAVELGAFASYATGPLRYRVKFRKDVASGHEGTLVDFDISAALYRSDSMALGSKISTTWANKRYARSYFGVTAAQSVTSGLAVYTPGSGIKDVTLTFGGEYRFTPAWAVVGNAGFSRLLGATKRSPLVRTRGSADQYSLGTFLVYTF